MSLKEHTKLTQNDEDRFDSLRALDRSKDGRRLKYKLSV